MESGHRPMDGRTSHVEIRARTGEAQRRRMTLLLFINDYHFLLLSRTSLFHRHSILRQCYRPRYVPLFRCITDSRAENSQGYKNPACRSSTVWKLRMPGIVTCSRACRSIHLSHHKMFPLQSLPSIRIVF